MIAFIDDHRGVYGVEPICSELPIAPSTYHAHVARRADPVEGAGRACAATSALRGEIRRVWEENFGVYGVRKVWRQLGREGVRRRALHRRAADAPDGPAGRLFAESRENHDQRQGGALSARPGEPASSRRRAPNQLWVSDFTYVATWTGFVYVAFVIDAYARRIVGWRVSRTRSRRASCWMRWSRRCMPAGPSKAPAWSTTATGASQYLSIRYTERLAEAGIEPSVGSVGDSYDNALAETVIGLFKTEVIRRRGPWRSLEAVEFATLEWVDWFNNRRLLEPIGNIPPAEAEARYYAELETTPWRRGLKQTCLRETRRGSLCAALAILGSVARIFFSAK